MPFPPACVLCSLCDIPTAAPGSPLTSRPCLARTDVVGLPKRPGPIPHGERAVTLASILCEWRSSRRTRRAAASRPARKKGCGRDFPLFSVKFSPAMYSTGFMTYSTVYWVKHKSATVFDMYPKAARHIHVYDGIYVYIYSTTPKYEGGNLTEERGKRRPLPNPNHVPHSGPDVHRLVYEPP